MHLAELGAAKISHTTCSAHNFERSFTNVSTDKCDYIGLYYIREGQAIFSNRQKDVTLSSGSYVLIDNRDEHSRKIIGDCTMTGLHFPRPWLESKFPNPEAFLLTPGQLSGWGLALRSALDTLRMESLEQQSLSPDIIAEQIAYLLALSYGSSEQGLRRGQRKTLERLRRIMRQRLLDPNLSPATLAEEEGMALRTLYALFAAAGTSFGRDLMAMRLDHALSLLKDARFDDYSISQIAQLSGFTCASHFGQRFRKSYGITPLSYRKLRQSS